MKFYASIRMDVRRIQVIKKGDEVTGARARIKVIKNKVAPPFKQVEIVITPEGIDVLSAIVEVAIQKGVLKKSGAFIKYKEETIGQGIDQTKQYLKEHPEVLDAIKKSSSLT